MPDIRQYPQANSLVSTDAFVIDRIGTGTMFADANILPGSGTVTSIVAGEGITATPDPITTTGTIALTIPVTVPDGGTGRTTLTAHQVLIGNGASGVNGVIGTAGQVLVSNGSSSDPSFQDAGGSGVTSVSLSVPLGGGTITGSGTLGTTSFTAHGVVLGEGSSALAVSAAGTAGQIFTSGGASADGSYKTNTAAITYVVDGGGATIPTGVAGQLFVPFGCTVTVSTLLADQSGSVVVDIKKGAYSAYPTVSSIVASAPPTISTAQKAQDSTLTGWTTAISANDCLQFSITSVTSIQRLTITLTVSKT